MVGGARTVAVAAVLVSLALGVTACGGDGDTSGTEPAAEGTGNAIDTSADDSRSPSAPTGADGDEREQIAAVMSVFERAVRDGDGAALCGTLAQTSVEGMSATQRVAACRQVATAIRTQEKGDPEVEVASLRIDGDQAVATVRSLTRPLAFQLVKLDGEWKISRMGPPGA